MLLVKKLLFSFPFIIVFIWFCILIRSFLSTPNLLLSLSSDTLLLFVWICLAAVLAGCFFAVFVTLSQDIKLILCPFPAVFLASFLLLPDPSRLLFAFGACIIFFVEYLLLNHTLTTYLTFSPSILLTPSIKTLLTLLFFLTSCCLYLSSKDIIQKQGFSLPESLIQTIMQFIPQDQTGISSSQTATPEEIAMVKKDPALMQQFGLTDDMLMQAQGSKSKQSETPTIKTQITTALQPYQAFFPPLLALSLFFTLQFFAAIEGILISPFLHLLFWGLEKAGFTHYTTETRTIRKLTL